MSRPEIVCIGEAMVEVTLDGATPGTAGIGFAGDTLNTAVYLKRLLPSANVAFATKIGRDVFSDGILNLMRSEGLDTRLVGYSDTRLPGLYAISTDAAGERSFLYWRNASAAREMFRSPALSFVQLMAFDVVYFSAISRAILAARDRDAFLSWLPHFRDKGGQVTFDSNYRANLWPDADTARAAVGAAWRQTDIGFPSLDDEIELFGDQDEAAVLARLRQFGVESGALKRGANGPVSLDGSPQSDFPVVRNVVDSTAAGDSFCGAYLAARLEGRSEPECLRTAHEFATRVLGVKGAIIPRDKSVLP
jgi:2-dehydro-3-deoxygluconokinase